MKRVTIFLFIAVLLAAGVYAQGVAEQRALEQSEILEQSLQPEQKAEQSAQTGQNREAPRQRENNSVTIEGTLKLERGVAAVESGGSLYFIPMLTRFMGFISELAEGAVISVEGYGFRNVVHPAKVTVDGRSYDFALLTQNMGTWIRDQGGAWPPAFGQSRMRDVPKQPVRPQMPRFNQRGENFRPNPPQMNKNPRNFQQPNRLAPRNTPERNSCDCNCGSGETL